MEPRTSARWKLGARAAALALLLGAVACSSTPSPPVPEPQPDASTPPAWETVYDGKDLGGAVLSAWGSGPRDVYVVGGPLGNGGPSVVQHYDGERWARLDAGGEDSFWWVSGSGPTDVWMVGEQGRITHWDGAAFRELPRVTTATVWGVWAQSPTDAWAVAGTPGKGTAAPNDLVLHWDGAAWAQDPLPGPPLGRALNKIWGTSSEDLYAIGESATVWHRKGTAWKLESEPPVAKGNLLTVYGCSATDVYAVGGADVIHSDGSGAWTSVAVDLSSTANGVTCGASGDVLIVGGGGLKVRLVNGEWINEFDVEPLGDIHGSWSDGAGSFWLAGGDFNSKPAPGKQRRAIVGRYGPGRVSTITP